jgi:EpsI family protein
LSDWRPVFENPDEEFLVVYHRESAGDVALFHAVYRSQHQGKELRGHRNSLLGEHYQSTETHRREILVGGGAIAVTEQRAAGVGQHDLLVWSLFAVDGRPDAMGFPSQLTYGIRSLLRFPTASVVAFAAECRPDCDSARHSLDAVAVQALPVLLSSLGAGRTVASAARNE